MKIVQLVYAYYLNGESNIEKAVKELVFSLSKAYEMYNYFLLLMVSVTRYALEQVEKKEEYNAVTHTDEPVSHKFVDNKFVMQLEHNRQLKDYVDDHKLTWQTNDDYLKHLYSLITESEYYKEYMSTPKSNYAEDKELWRILYKNVVMKDEYLDDILEEKSLYWNDDRETVDTFVLKTIKKFDQKNGAAQVLLQDYKDTEDLEYAQRLFRKTILNAEYYNSLISSCTKNWEFDRLAFMDVVIMQIAVAEMVNFPNIPVSVTINEYVELAKCYSTPKSGGYVNGIIDAVAKRLYKEGKLHKK